MNEKIDLRPKVLELIKKNGPLVPRDLVKEIGGDTFIIGAVLMQLKDSGKVLVSHTKVGGTPAYYCEGQEENLQELEKYLNEKEKYAYSLLKEKKILRDYGEPTVVRLSLRLIKDFAIPLVVEVNGEDEVFWKWYLTPLDEAEEIIKEILPTIKPSPKAEEKLKEEEPSKENDFEEVEKYFETEKEETIPEKKEMREEIIEEVPIQVQKEEIKEEIKETGNEEVSQEINEEPEEEPKEEIEQIQPSPDKKTEEIQEIIINAAQEGGIIKEIVEGKKFIKEEELKSDEPKEQIIKPAPKKEKRVKKGIRRKSKPKEKPKIKKKAEQKIIKKDTKQKEAKPKKEGFFRKIKKLFW